MKIFGKCVRHRWSAWKNTGSRGGRVFEQTRRCTREGCDKVGTRQIKGKGA